MSNYLRILVIDDDAAIREACRRVLAKNGHQVESAESGAKGLAMFGNMAFDLVLLDLRMPDFDGMDVLSQLKEQDPKALIIVISGHGSVETAVAAMKLGAFDFLSKPFTPGELRYLVGKASEQHDLLVRSAFLEEESRRKSLETRIITSSASVRKMLAMLDKVAATDTTVLLTGESGTGKGLFARRLHELSARRDNPFVPVDCSTLVPTLFESELFGHVKGSFTGADNNKIGKFELSDGGTLFFDEIGNISPDIQAKLLKAVEDRAICRVGSNRLIRVDNRLVAATNRDLSSAVKQGAFREDLFYRFNVINLNLPPLRDRPEDVPLLAGHFLEKFRRLASVGLRGFSPEALELLSGHDWPGNVRELENTVQRLVILATKPVIEVADIRANLPMVNSQAGGQPLRLDQVERQHILRVLKMHDGHRSQSAAALGIDRKTLRNKIQKYGIQE